MNTSKTTARDLLAQGGKWVDIQWKDFIKMPDGSYWKPETIVQDDGVQMILAAA